MPLIESMLAPVIGAAAGQIFGQAGEERQMQHQRELMDLQNKYNMGSMYYSNQLQYDLWKKTGPTGLMAELKKAGLNPALMYGMSGASGGTTGAAGPQSVSTNGAPNNTEAVYSMTAAGLQAAQLQANIELTKATTAKTEAETAKTSGVDTQEANTRIKDLMQGITNKQAQEAIMRVDQRLKMIEEKVQGQTFKDRIEYIQYQAEQAMYELSISKANEYVTTATQSARRQIIERTAVQEYLKQALIKAETRAAGANANATEIEANINKNWGERMKIAQLSNWIQENEIKWENLSNEQKKTEIQNQLKNNTIDHADMDQLIDFIDAFWDGRSGQGGKRNPIGFKY